VVGKKHGKFFTYCTTCTAAAVAAQNDNDVDNDVDTDNADDNGNGEKKQETDGNKPGVQAAGAVKNKQEFRKKRLGEKIAAKKDAREKIKHKPVSVTVQPKEEKEKVPAPIQKGGKLPKALRDKIKKFEIKKDWYQ
jgi:hypothetical protein